MSAGPAPSAPIVTHALSKVYPDGLPAVTKLDLEVRTGEIFGLLGPNGAGKTTTIGMLTTRVVPTSGQALVAGADVRVHPAAVRQRIGVVPQTNTLDRSISVRENLDYHGRYFGLGRAEARRRADALLARFSLAERAHAMVDTLSGGMAQRLMVARALLHRPAVLFLDEPTTGLDPQSRIALWDQLRELGREGQTILVTTHYMEEADQLCDRVAIIDCGRLLAEGTPATLKRQVEADAVVALTLAQRSADRVAELAQAVASDDGVLRTDHHDTTVRVHATAGGALLPRLVQRAAALGVDVLDASVSEPSLETVFIALTGRDLRE